MWDRIDLNVARPVDERWWLQVLLQVNCVLLAQSREVGMQLR